MSVGAIDDVTDNPGDIDNTDTSQDQTHLLAGNRNKMKWDGSLTTQQQAQSRQADILCHWTRITQHQRNTSNAIPFLASLDPLTAA